MRVITTDKREDVVLRQLRDYCDRVLSSLGRVDQRRWGEVYIRGLIFCEGRRSIKHIAAHVGGCSEQSLQQFVNQSPWDPEPVRRQLATALAH
ncbi:transposase, partial [Kibdelosporangium lantanae]